MLDNIFKEFGLSIKETKVYLSLLENGAKSASALAKDTDTPRTTLYGHIEKLKNAGFINHVSQEGTKIFAAEPPEKLNLLYKQKIDRMRVSQRQLENYIPDLTARMGSKNTKPKLQYFESKNALHNMMNDILLHDNITIFSFWPVQSMINAVGEDYLNHFNIIRIKKNIRLKAIWPPNQAVNIRRYPFMGAGNALLREVRIAPEKINSHLSYMIYHDKIMIISSRNENYGFILQSQDMSETMKNHFMFIWKLSHPHETKKEDTAEFISYVSTHQNEISEDYE